MLNLKEAIPSKQRMEALATHIFRRIINFHRDKSGEILGRCCVRCVWEGVLRGRVNMELFRNSGSDKMGPYQL